jgi:membrane-bound serine protease (ClpP class)
MGLRFARNGEAPPGGSVESGSVRRSLLLLILLLPILLAAEARAASPSPEAGVDVVKVQGVIDPSLASYIRGSIRAAERSGATVVLQIDSRGSYDGYAQELGIFIRSATVPVVAWVGPTGARAAGGAVFLVYSSGVVALAPGAGIGPGRPFDLGTKASAESASAVAAGEATLEKLASGGGFSADVVRRVVSGPVLPAGPAVDAGAATLIASDVVDLLAKLDGRSVPTPDGPVTIRTSGRAGGQRVQVRFHEIGLLQRILHAVSTPTAVYVLLVLGLWLIAFELTQPGFGVAGIGGVAAIALAGYGLAVIPVSWPGLTLIVAGIGLQGLDVAIRRVALLTLAGTALFAAGSIYAWGDVAPSIDLSVWLIALFTVAGALFFGFGMTVALRSRDRARTAQVGLVGLVGEARGDLNPEGAVFVKGTLWRARSSNGPIPKGRRVRVRGIDGLILRVEQEPD